MTDGILDFTSGAFAVCIFIFFPVEIAPERQCCILRESIYMQDRTKEENSGDDDDDSRCPLEENSANITRDAPTPTECSNISPSDGQLR